MKKNDDPYNVQKNTASKLHKKAIVIEGLVYRCDGYDKAAEEGGVTAVHTTVCDIHDDLIGALSAISKTLKRFQNKNNKWLLAKNTADILTAKKQGKVAIILGMQNAKPIGDTLENLHLFSALGVRIIQLTYNERNFIGDGSLEPTNAGLSRFGVNFVRKMNDLGILVDLSHVGEKSGMDTIEVTKHPVVFTHANPRAFSDNPRNKSDEIIKAMARSGGVIGICAYGPLCWNPKKKLPPTIDDIANHIDYVANLVGIDYVGIGNDFPMGVPRDIMDQAIKYTNTNYPQMSSEYNRLVGDGYEQRYARGFENLSKFPNLTKTLLEKGYSEKDVLKVLGGNFMRVFKKVWNTEKS